MILHQPSTKIHHIKQDYIVIIFQINYNLLNFLLTLDDTNYQKE